jgi:hypothetical protein
MDEPMIGWIRDVIIMKAMQDQKKYRKPMPMTKSKS